MRILAKTCVMMAICLVAAEVAEADGWLGRRPRRRVNPPWFSRPATPEGTMPDGWLGGGRNHKIDPSQPFILLTLPRDPVHLGEVYGPDLRQMGARLTARVVANCPYHISASFNGLTHEGHRVTISPTHMTVMINGRSVPVGAQRVPIASEGPTPYSGVDVPIDLQVGVKAMNLYPAGRYRGSLVITVTPGH